MSPDTGQSPRTDPCLTNPSCLKTVKEDLDRSGVNTPGAGPGAMRKRWSDVRRFRIPIRAEYAYEALTPPIVPTGFCVRANTRVRMADNTSKPATKWSPPAKLPV